MNATNTSTANMSTAQIGAPANHVLLPSSRRWRVLTFNNRLSRRTGLILWLIATVAVALYLGWGLVVAAGLSTLVLGLLPCAAMCALGLCAAGSGKKCSNDIQNSKGEDQ